MLFASLERAHILKRLKAEQGNRLDEMGFDLAPLGCYLQKILNKGEK